MIKTYLELIEATIAKYEHAEALSKVNDSEPGVYAIKCFYEAKLPGSVGCGIGCHMATEHARQLDENFGPSTAINTLCRTAGARAIINQYFDVEAISITQMRRFQGLHDASDSVEQYLGLLRIEREIILNPPSDGIPF